MSKAEILYLDVLLGDRIQEMKLAGIRRYALARGWNVRVLSESASRPKKLRRQLKMRRPVGCIVECAASHRDIVPSIFKGIPVVYLDCPQDMFGGRVVRIVHDGAATARAAFHELAANHPSAYAIVGFKSSRFWSELREKTFRALVAETGKPCLVFPRRRERSRLRMRRLVRWLAALPVRCAVFAVNDTTAFDVLTACVSAGRHVPKDLTLLGVDNLEEECERSSPRLTSVQVDSERAGYRAAQLLGNQLLFGELADGMDTYGPQLTVRRESTRGFSRREPRILSALEMIRRQACSGLTAAEVVRRLRSSRSLVDLRFRETLGHSILDEIQNVRIESACMYLLQTDVPIDAIASLCGYHTSIALRKAFRRRMGMSLREWRRANGPC